MKIQFEKFFTNKKDTVKDAIIYPTNEYILRFDGCSKGNPGNSGAGAVIYKYDEEIWSDCIYVGDNCTNNYAEYSGLILGLNKASELGIKNIVVEGDSQLVIKQMRDEYRVTSANIIYIHSYAKRLSRIFDNISYSHIYRDKNKRADKLSNDGLLKKPN